jgi:hypothetical protein
MNSQIKLFRGWWLCKDTTIPTDYPPNAKNELVDARLRIDALKQELRIMEENEFELTRRVKL